MNDETTSDKPRKRRKKKKRSKSGAEITAAPASPVEPPEDAAASGSMTKTLLVAVVALGIGGAAGWFARGGETAAVEPGPDPASSGAPVGSAAAAAACGSWSTKVCGELGEKSEHCATVTAAAAILPNDVCTTALAKLPATLAKAKTVLSACDKLVKKLCADIGPETESCKMVTERTPTFPPAQCRGMLGQYDKVLGELKNQEKQRQPLSADLAAKLAAGDVPSFGPADAKVTVVEFSDFECPYCSKAAETVTALKKKYGDRVRFVFRQFPLSFHKKAQLAAEASLAAHAQGKFWEFHDKVFANQREIGRADLEKYAKELGLDMAKFKKALDDNTYAAAVKADMALAEGVPVGGTPTIIVGTKRIEEPGLAQISAAIDAQLGS